MKDKNMDEKDETMLELLSHGASAKDMAREMGYQVGTVRVYLHHMYRKIGVRNKTDAVIWYLAKERTKVDRAGAKAVTVQAQEAEESFGDMAMRTSLYSSLGVMGIFLGAYGRVWEVASRLKGLQVDAELNTRRTRSRRLWRALLEGDGAYGKRVYEEDEGNALLLDSPPDAVMLLCLLSIGGYTAAADRLGSKLVRKRKAGFAISTSEHTLLRSLRDALDGKDDALASLYHLAAEQSTSPVLRHLAMVALYYTYRARKDLGRARDTANAIWTEAEATHQHLRAMGERPLGRESAVPPPEGIGAKGLSAYREKVTAAR
jgi:DNA-binding CsgD family transcriptional regulator